MTPGNAHGSREHVWNSVKIRRLRERLLCKMLFVFLLEACIFDSAMFESEADGRKIGRRQAART